MSMNNILGWLLVLGWLGLKACVLLFWLGVAMWMIGIIRKIDVWEPNKVTVVSVAAPATQAPSANESAIDEAFEAWLPEAGACSYDTSNWPNESEVPTLFRSRYHEYLVENNAE
jgi:hypothetical protein